MHWTKSKWRGDRGARAFKIMSVIETSIAALPDEDLLDLYDIFAGSDPSGLKGLTEDEMKRRDLVA